MKPRDKVILLKENGNEFSLEARMQFGKILLFMPDSSIPVEEGDKILRKLPSDIKEQYLVTEATYYAGGRLTPRHYRLRVTKQTANIEKQIEIKTRRLAKLKEKEALKGIDTEPHYLVELEDLEAEIEELKRQKGKNVI